MSDDLTRDFLQWKKDFSWEDDGLHAFLSIRALEKIRFELTMRGEGYVERIREITES